MSGKFVTRVLAGWCAVGLIALAGCGGEEPSRTLELDGGNTEAAAPEATEESTQESTDEVLGEPREGELTRGASVASTPQEKEVAEAWFTYLEEFVRVVGEPDPAAFRLNRLAEGPAFHSTRAYAHHLAGEGLRLGGGMIATMLEIEVTDDSAVVRGCLRSSMLKVDAANEPVVEMKDPWIASEHELISRGDEWLVMEHELEGVPKCV